MKIERINENQIRCTLTSFDLSVRDLNLGELAYGSEKAKKLFQEMIQKASKEVGFDAEEIPLMVEAIPLSNESIMLIITKIEDPEELDTRFSKFSPASEEETVPPLTSELLEGAEGILELFSRTMDKKTEKKPATPGQPVLEEKAGHQPVLRVFTFQTLDQICHASRIAGPLCTSPNTLYKNPANKRYYLVLHEAVGLEDAFHRICNLLSEFGEAVKTSPASEAYYEEHYDTIVREHALQSLAAL